MGRHLVGLMVGIALLLGAGSANAAVTLYPVPTSGGEPWGIAVGPDGALWFTEYNGNKLGRITASGHITEFPLPAGSGAEGLAAGPDGNLWLAAYGGGTILRVTPAGTVTTFNLPPDGTVPYDIVSGPDGNLWATVQPRSGPATVGAIDKVTPTGQITEYALPDSSGAPFYITRGPDGNLWFTALRGSPLQGAIGSITMAGQITEYPIGGTGAHPLGITAGPDGNVWFTDQSNGSIGRSTTTGQITEFAARASNMIQGITAGPDGALWFADPSYGSLTRITTTGTVTQNLLPGAGHGYGPDVLNVVSGPDDALWFTVFSRDEIGRFGFAAPACTVPRMIGLSLSSAKRKIVAAGCRVGKVSFVRRHRRRRGTVVAQRPAGGRTVAQGTKVSLTVAR